MLDEKLIAIRTAVADYVRSEGCNCCRNHEVHEDAARRLARLLEVPMYADGSGYNFYAFISDEELKAKLADAL